MKPSDQFKTALDQLEGQAKLVEDGAAVATSFVYSGGRNAEHQEEIPGLYLTEIAAVDSWRRFALGWLVSEKAASFRFEQPPKVERFAMTQADDMNTHRLAAHRYGIRSKMVIVSVQSSDAGARMTKSFRRARPKAKVQRASKTSKKRIKPARKLRKPAKK